MAQMPEEGRKFGIVDSYWKDIMSEAVRTELFLLSFTTKSTKNYPNVLPEKPQIANSTICRKIHLRSIHLNGYSVALHSQTQS